MIKTSFMIKIEIVLCLDIQYCFQDNRPYKSKIALFYIKIQNLFMYVHIKKFFTIFITYTGILKFSSGLLIPCEISKTNSVPCACNYNFIFYCCQFADEDVIEVALKIVWGVD